MAGWIPIFRTGRDIKRVNARDRHGLSSPRPLDETLTESID